jgi:hypothetical protein
MRMLTGLNAAKPGGIDTRADFFNSKAAAYCRETLLGLRSKHIITVQQSLGEIA